MLACKHMGDEPIGNSGVEEIKNIQATPKNGILQMSHLEECCVLLFIQMTEVSIEG